MHRGKVEKTFFNTTLDKAERKFLYLEIVMISGNKTVYFKHLFSAMFYGNWLCI